MNKGANSGNRYSQVHENQQPEKPAHLGAVMHQGDGAKSHDTGFTLGSLMRQAKEAKLGTGQQQGPLGKRMGQR